MAAFESGRRLCLLFEAGPSRFAVEATSVVEVAPPDAHGESIRVFHELKDLSQLLGGAPEIRPGMAVVLDVSPTLAIRIKEVRGVVDVAKEAFFLLPPGLDGLAAHVRGAFLSGGRLHLEIIAETLPQKVGGKFSPAPRALSLLEKPPDRALIFESQGRLYGIPLALVSQVVAQNDSFCPIPSQVGPVSGLFPHGQVLFPIYTAAGLLGGSSKPEPFFVMSELAGRNVGLCAQRVLGVHQMLVETEVQGEYSARGLPAPALFLDLQRMFS